MTLKVFYVYQYVDKNTGIPIYVGKGKSDRKQAHMRNARKGLDSAFYQAIRDLGYEEGIEIRIVQENMSEARALRLETKLIDEIGRVDLGTGPLLNRTSGGEGISGGLNMFGYKSGTISEKITDMVVKGMLIQDMPEEIRKFVAERQMKVKWVESRIIPHIQEMGNVGCHYKGPKIRLKGWQFSLDGKMVDVNTLTLETKGFLKVHGNLPLNNGFVAGAGIGEKVNEDQPTASVAAVDEMPGQSESENEIVAVAGEPPIENVPETETQKRESIFGWIKKHLSQLFSK